jgi:hypothetical protein
MSKYNRFVELINCATDKDIGNDNIRNKRVYQICTYLQNSSASAVKLNLDKVNLNPNFSQGFTCYNCI